MKSNKIMILFVTLAMVAVLGFAGITACGDGESVEVTGSETGDPAKADFTVTYSINSGYTVTIPASLNITYPNTTATVNVKGTATLPTTKELCVIVNRGSGLSLKNETNSISYSISCAKNQEEDFIISSVPQSVINDGCTMNTCELIGGIKGSWSNPSFSTNITFNIGSLTGIPSGVYSQTLTFYTWVQDIPSTD